MPLLSIYDPPMSMKQIVITISENMYTIYIAQHNDDILYTQIIHADDPREIIGCQSQHKRKTEGNNARI